MSMDVRLLRMLKPLLGVTIAVEMEGIQFVVVFLLEVENHDHHYLMMFLNHQACHGIFLLMGIQRKDGFDHLGWSRGLGLELLELVEMV